jgi:hypothetical protein
MVNVSVGIDLYLYVLIGVLLYVPLLSPSAIGCSGHQGDIDKEMRGRLPFGRLETQIPNYIYYHWIVLYSTTF